MEATIKMRKDGQNALIERAMEQTIWYKSNLLAITHITTYVNENDQSAIQDMTISGDVWTMLMTKYEAINKKRKMAMFKKLFN
jgi:hypothetical protein